MIKLSKLLLFNRVALLLVLLLGITSRGILYANTNNDANTDLNNSKLFIDKPQYILGSGDVLFISFIGLPQFNASYSVGPDGLMYLPEVGSLQAEGLTVNELRNALLQSYDEFIIDPKIEIQVVRYRPMRVYISGEVKRPGLYTFKGGNTGNLGTPTSSLGGFSQEERIQAQTIDQAASSIASVDYAPRIFDAIRISSGVTPNANLSEISIIRNNARSSGGGKIKTTINLLKLLTNGDQSQNIRIFDGDTIIISRSEKVLKDQILKANKTNLSPEYITVFITGNVERAGASKIRQGSGLIQAIYSSGGKKLMTGNIEFIRFNDDGTTLRNQFRYDAKAPINTAKNPILMSGDVINVRKSALGTASEVIGEISRPVLGGYALYNIFD
ncbi:MULTISPECIES: polysaccharide biosynthesis/export family protein [unclassified Prochlorococcus]|uniref:polysaccharide biosynthesis/export family protein n=1 Tax=unclassified Prochlorococcus TaxID=2627481 RepID=UPI000533BDEE|nr:MULTISPECIES: polysaccharide biosynthesis/export family protein [unclassified Prochlorococcus]KGG16313.1 Periplasmic protein involved in polysaccharide export [Prochlorococcus sp. MIT 0603]KGG17953.1 Periplasmic protein involved in polysaccharide export [Prochlorococcus sp. MIT 0602]